MFPSKTLLSLVFLALSAVDASPLAGRGGTFSLPLTRGINMDPSVSVVQGDIARAQTLRQVGGLGKRDASSAITNGKVHYSAVVGVGSPPTDYTLLIDTGSSNTFVGANKTYVQTETSQDTGNTASVTYGSGSWSGTEWIDTVTLAPDAVISQQSIGVANQTTGMNDIDGILGVGPVDLTEGTVTNTGNVPTVMDNLFSQGTISEEVLGIYFVPDSESPNDGELTFGGYDESATVGPVTYVPITKTSPASQYWGVDLSIMYGNTVLLSAAGIVDTGSTLVLLATDAFHAYQQATGATPDSATSLLKITPDQYNDLLPLIFNIGDVPFELVPNAQIWPRSLNTAIGGDSSSIYLVVSDIGTPSGSGLDFILGYTFLERYYTINDVGKKQVGFALTRHTLSENN